MLKGFKGFVKPYLDGAKSSIATCKRANLMLSKARAEGRLPLKRRDRRLIDDAYSQEGLMPVATLLAVPIIYSMPALTVFLPAVLDSVAVTPAQKQNLAESRSLTKAKTNPALVNFLQNETRAAFTNHAANAILRKDLPLPNAEIQALNTVVEKMFSGFSFRKHTILDLLKSWNKPSSSFLTESMLRSKLSKHMYKILSDDKQIKDENLLGSAESSAVSPGSEPLSLEEITAACEERGLVTAALSEDQMRRWLREWVDLTTSGQRDQHAHASAKSLPNPSNLALELIVFLPALKRAGSP